MPTGTHERIIISFFRLAMEHPEQHPITLAEIAEEAHVSRQAIYRKHFKSSEEIVGEVRKRIKKDLQKKLKTSSPETGVSPFVFIANEVLPLAYEYRVWLRVLTTTAIDPSWQRFLEFQFANYLKPYLEMDKHYDKVSTKFKERLISKRVVDVISLWLSEEFPDPPESFAKTFLYLVSSSSNDLVKEEYRFVKK